MRIQGTRELHTDGAANRKPYRTKDMKRIARDKAIIKDGTYVSNAPKLYHPVREQKRGN